MTDQLIPVTCVCINGRSSRTVNARDLHFFLEVRTKFSDWLRSRIDEYHFKENVAEVLNSTQRTVGIMTTRLDEVRRQTLLEFGFEDGDVGYQRSGLLG